MNKKKRLNITFLDFDDVRNPLLGAGQARATFEVGKRLVQRGHQVTVLSSRYPNARDRTEQDIHYQHIGLGSKHIRMNNLAYILSLPAAVRKINSDVVVECFTAPISTLFSPLFTCAPVVALPSMFDAKAFSKKYHLPFYLIERVGLRFYKYFLPYSTCLDQKMKRVNSEVVSRIVPEGVGKEYFLVRKKPAKHILFLGRLDVEQKGIDLLIEAYAEFSHKFPYPLLILGNGTDTKRVRKLIHSYKLDGLVRLGGPIYGKRKMEILSRSEFVVLPSRHETFSCFALEALASGLPIVCFDIPGLEWLPRSVSFKAPALDVKGYAKCLLRASRVNNKDQLSQKARRVAMRYSWDRVVDHYEDFFYQILKREQNNTYAN